MTAPSPTPRGRLAGVPLPARRIWSLLYRATRRQAVAVDRVTTAVHVLAARQDELRNQVVGLEALHRRLVADVQGLTERVAWLEDQVSS